MAVELGRPRAVTPSGPQAEYGGDAATPIDDEDALVGEAIVCFAKDWDGDPTSCTHVMRGLARTNTVLWLNSIATRTPALSRRGDLRKIGRKLAGFLRGPVRAEENLWVYTPLLLPMHHRPLVIALNRWILRLTVGAVARRLGMRGFQLWTFVPTSALYLGALGEETLVYYCTDNWAQFSTVDGAGIGGMVRTLASRADVVFATSRPLTESLRPQNPETHLASHGVEFEKFAAALLPETPLPDDLPGLPGPILGYYGLVEDWLDLDLLVFLARRHPEWTICLVGKVCVDTSPLAPFPNIHLLGRKPHAELPRYCKGFAVGLIPHKVNALTEHMNPIKLREYMSAGLPIVSTALPEMRHFPDHCAVAGDYAEFEAAVQDALQRDSLQRRRERSRAMADETWESKIKIIGATVRRAQRRSCPSPSVVPLQ